MVPKEEILVSVLILSALLYVTVYVAMIATGTAVLP